MIGRNDIVRSKKLRKSVTTTNNGLVKCRANVSLEAMIFTSSLVDFDFKVEYNNGKRQSRKSRALPNIRIENEAQINDNVDRETNSFLIKIYIKS